MEKLEKRTLKRIEGFELGWKKESFFIPDYSDEHYVNKVREDDDQFYVPDNIEDILV